VALPLTVLGFYLLLAMGPQGPVGQFTQGMGIGLLPFSFWGLVVASAFYSLPFWCSRCRMPLRAWAAAP
jgi:molybdate transport system permease protein